MNENIIYKTDQISRFYSKNRLKWNQFYPSERKVLEKEPFNEETNILDLGCGCGGLGIALNERFGVTKYTGIDINNLAIKEAIKLNPDGNFFSKDVLDIREDEFQNIDYVISLSCIDWNVEFEPMLKKAWSILNNGKFILSIRLTNGKGINNINDSYQFINFNGLNEGETAPYNVYNFQKWIKVLKTLPNLSSIYGYGYNGKPASTAVTIYDEVCFAVFSLTKSITFISDIKEEFELPAEYIS